MSKKVNWTLINEKSLETLNAFLMVSSNQFKSELKTLTDALSDAEDELALVEIKRDNAASDLVIAGKSQLEATAEATSNYSAMLSEAEEAVNNAKDAVDKKKETRKVANANAVALIPDSLYKGYALSINEDDTENFVVGTAELLGKIGLGGVSEVQIRKTAVIVSRWVGGKVRATGKAAAKAALKNKTKPVFKADMVRALCDYIALETGGWEYVEGRTAIQAKVYDKPETAETAETVETETVAE